MGIFIQKNTPRGYRAILFESFPERSPRALGKHGGLIMGKSKETKKESKKKPAKSMKEKKAAKRAKKEEKSGLTPS